MKNVGFPCVFAQNGPPKGGQKWSQKQAKNGAVFGPDLGKRGSKIHQKLALGCHLGSLGGAKLV